MNAWNYEMRCPKCGDHCGWTTDPVVSGQAQLDAYVDVVCARSDSPSPIALAVLWSASAVLAMLIVALLLAVLSVLIGGHPWWTR